MGCMERHMDQKLPQTGFHIGQHENANVTLVNFNVCQRGTFLYIYFFMTLILRWLLSVAHGMW